MIFSELSEVDVAEVARLYERCTDCFLLQDGVVPTLEDASELFTDVPPERDAHDQTILGWRGDDGLYAIAAIPARDPHAMRPFRVPCVGRTGDRRVSMTAGEQ